MWLCRLICTIINRKNWNSGHLWIRSVAMTQNQTLTKLMTDKWRSPWFPHNLDFFVKFTRVLSDINVTYIVWLSKQKYVMPAFAITKFKRLWEMANPPSFYKNYFFINYFALIQCDLHNSSTLQVPLYVLLASMHVF